MRSYNYLCYITKPGLYSLITILICVVTCRAEDLPLNPDVKQETINETICSRGYTRTVRPPAGVTNTIKHEMLRAWGYSADSMHDFILDHKIPLSLGGAPNNLRNFTLQTEGSSKDKDRVELCLSRTVCAGKITLQQAQQEIWMNWKRAGRLCSGYTIIDQVNDSFR